MLCHLSALAGLLVPSIGAALGPLVVWLIRRNDHPTIDAHGRESFEALIRPLRQSARAALRLIYIEGLNQREAGEEIGISESRCSQIVKEALAYLRAHHDGDAA